MLAYKRIEVTNCADDRIHYFRIKEHRSWNQLLRWKATMKRVSVRANNCALCHNGITMGDHPATQGIVNVSTLRLVASIRKVEQVSLIQFALVFLRMTERKDIWQSRYYTIPRLYMTLAGLWPYHSIRDRYLHFVPTFTICSIILIPIVHNWI